MPVCDDSLGMTRFCALATRNVLLLVAQTYPGQLGGYGAPENRYRTWASRAVPDFRRLANPEQLRDAAVHWALATAFGACHERADETVYSRLRDYHDAKRKEAVARWNLAFNSDPDGSDNADARSAAGAVRVTRI